MVNLQSLDDRGVDVVTWDPKKTDREANDEGEITLFSLSILEDCRFSEN